MTDLTVYTTSDPEVLACIAGQRAAIVEWNARLTLFQESIAPGTRQVYLATFPGYPRMPSGIEHRSDWPIPDGWRVETKGRLRGKALVPDKRTPAGKEVAALLRRLRSPRPAPLRGMPATVSWEHTERGYSHIVASPRTQRLGDTEYVVWRDVPESALADVDPTVWERVPLSRYYAAVEATPAGATP